MDSTKNTQLNALRESNNALRLAYHTEQSRAKMFFCFALSSSQYRLLSPFLFFCQESQDIHFRQRRPANEPNRVFPGHDISARRLPAPGSKGHYGQTIGQGKRETSTTREWKGNFSVFISNHPSIFLLSTVFCPHFCCPHLIPRCWSCRILRRPCTRHLMKKIKSHLPPLSHICLPPAFLSR